MSDQKSKTYRPYRASLCQVFEPCGLILCSCSNETEAKRVAGAIEDLRAEVERLRARSDAFRWVEIMFDNVPVSELGVEVIKLVERFHAATLEREAGGCEIAAGLAKAEGKQ